MATHRYRGSRVAQAHGFPDRGPRLAYDIKRLEQSRSTGLLLGCGVLVAPLFFGVVLVQAFTRAGFDIKRTPLSLLSLGDLGWIQIANFIVTGLLALACAVGMRRVLAGSKGATWGPALIATFGLGLILAGVFHPDPGYGFPPGVGAPTAMLPMMSRHASIHSAGFAVVMLSLVLDCFVFFRVFRFRSRAGMGIYSVATGVLVPALLASAIATSTTGLIIVVGAIAFSWVSVTAAYLRADLKGDLL